jgi:hypothetical protein
MNFDTHIIHTLDTEELFWTKTGNLLLNDVETGEKKITFVDRAMMKRYRKKMRDYVSGLKRFCGEYGINYYLYNTGIPFEDFLIDYFHQDSVLV